MIRRNLLIMLLGYQFFFSNKIQNITLQKLNEIIIEKQIQITLCIR